MEKNIIKLLKANNYPGRGIIAGLSPDGEKAIFAYFIMGRSTASRNRLFEAAGDEVHIKLIKCENEADTSLIFYTPVKVFGKNIVVTNGDQTQTICDYLNSGKGVIEALESRTFEPDAPHFTPRISSVFNLENKKYLLSILKSANKNASVCLRQYFEYEALAGAAHFIHTYKCNAATLPSFEGEPKEIETANSAEEFATEIWESLDFENKISLVVRYTDIKTGEYTQKIINKYSD